MTMYKHCLKRVFDFCISLIALLLVSPILLVVSVLLLFFNKGAGVFFLQERPGKNIQSHKVQDNDG